MHLRFWIDRYYPLLLRSFNVLIFLAISIQASIVVYIALNHLNFLQVDFAGHIASAFEFQRGKYHDYNPNVFLGAIHGLFYPPLQDFVLSILLYFSSSDWQRAAEFYLAGVGLFYLFSWGRLIFSLESTLAKLFLTGSFLLIFNIKKSNLVFFQGLSLVDLVVTGLSAQFLSMSFFLLFISEVLVRKKRGLGFSVFMVTLTLTSHIVMGLSALAFLFIAGVTSDQRKLVLRVALLSLLCSAFFILPFIGYSEYLARSTVISESPSSVLILIFFLSGFVGVLAGIRSIPFALCLTAALLSGSDWLATHSPEIVRLPDFHYYRLVSVALILALVSFALLIQMHSSSLSRSFSLKRFSILSVAIVAIILLLKTFDYQKFDGKWVSFQRSKFDLSRANLDDHGNFGRHFVFGQYRAADTGIDSLLTIENEHFASTKGLFWENSRSNTLQSSFLSTLLDPQVVLNHYRYDHITCEFMQCLTDEMFRYLNVTSVVANLGLLTYAGEDKQECLYEILKNGTPHSTFAKSGEIEVGGFTHHLFKLNDKERAGGAFRFSRELVEPLAQEGALSAGALGETSNQILFKHIGESCKAGVPAPLGAVIVNQSERDRLKIKAFTAEELESVAPIQIRHNDSDSAFAITNLKAEERAYVVKLAPQPGLRFFDRQGNELPSIEAYPFVVVIAKGGFEIRYQRPILLWFGYCLSFIGLLLTLAIMRKSRWFN